MAESQKFIALENKENAYEGETTFTLESFKELQENRKKAVTDKIQEISKKCRDIGKLKKLKIKLN
jgi:hypothetical protein